MVRSLGDFQFLETGFLVSLVSFPFTLNFMHGQNQYKNERIRNHRFSVQYLKFFALSWSRDPIDCSVEGTSVDVCHRGIAREQGVVVHMSQGAGVRGCQNGVLIGRKKYSKKKL